MIVAYENTDEDVAAWTAAYFRHTRPGRAAMRRMRISYSVFMSLLVLLEYVLISSAVLNIEPSALTAMLVALISGMAAYGWLDYRTRRGPMRAYGKRLQRAGLFENFIGWRQTEVLPAGLRTVSQSGESLRYWSSIKGIEDAETHYLLRFGTADIDIVPKRAFRDDAHRRQFLALVGHYQSAAVAIAPTQPALAGTVIAAVAAGAPHVGAAQAAASPTTHAPGAPWWRNRASVEGQGTEATVTQRIAQQP
jgi:hypothetical protein